VAFAGYPRSGSLERYESAVVDSPMRPQALADEGRHIAHTTAITALNIMFEKKYLTRKKQGKSFLFAPRVSREQVCEGMLGDVVRRAFDGSATALMLSLSNCAELDEEELKELRQLINRKMSEQT
jgi:predicted transcriptional regulator